MTLQVSISPTIDLEMPKKKLLCRAGGSDYASQRKRRRTVRGLRFWLGTSVGRRVLWGRFDGDIRCRTHSLSVFCNENEFVAWLELTLRESTLWSRAFAGEWNSGS